MNFLPGYHGRNFTIIGRPRCGLAGANGVDTLAKSIEAPLTRPSKDSHHDLLEAWDDTDKEMGVRLIS